MLMHLLRGWGWVVVLMNLIYMLMSVTLLECLREPLFNCPLSSVPVLVLCVSVLVSLSECVTFSDVTLFSECRSFGLL